MKTAKKWILAIDDDADDRFWIEQAVAAASFRNFTYEFWPAKNAEEGRALMEKIVAECPDGEDIVVFCDVNMPGESGLQLLEWRREKTRFLRVPIVIVSSFDRRTDVVRAFELGAIACMFKPPQPNAVKGLLQSIMQLGGSWRREVDQPISAIKAGPVATTAMSVICPA